jgi:hypothetical protein
VATALLLPSTLTSTRSQSPFKASTLSPRAKFLSIPSLQKVLFPVLIKPCAMLMTYERSMISSDSVATRTLTANAPRPRTLGRTYSIDIMIRDTALALRFQSCRAILLFRHALPVPPCQLWPFDDRGSYNLRYTRRFAHSALGAVTKRRVPMAYQFGEDYKRFASASNSQSQPLNADTIF